ncbi:peptidylprolyl isomerase [Marinimicrobium alkaliphilum]|uniref:peptidylprolyl isomerase n=1 Tax=Marinimicrobium alkaliphilum TaxID=2202654 RepID=UPI001E5E90F8|nr:peptidylprolyl isomerase [Marinimicrobium alkaliphilum]
MRKLLISLGALLAALTVSAASAAEPAPLVRLSTDLGDLVVELDPEAAPKTVENFLAYVDSGFYAGTIFHRVIPGFVAQGGGMTFDFTRKETREPVVNESHNGLQNRYMTVAMARTADPDSATAQFYINLRHNPSLDPQGEAPGYTVFGRVIEGGAVVQAIAREPRGRYREYPDAPNEPIRILRAERIEVSRESEDTE